MVLLDLKLIVTGSNALDMEMGYLLTIVSALVMVIAIVRNMRRSLIFSVLVGVVYIGTLATPYPPWSDLELAFGRVGLSVAGAIILLAHYALAKPQSRQLIVAE